MVVSCYVHPQAICYEVIRAEEKLAAGKHFSSFSAVKSALNNWRDTTRYKCMIAKRANTTTESDLIVSIQVNHQCVQVPIHLLQRPMCTLWATLTYRGKGYSLFSGLGCQAKITLIYNKGLNCLVVRECDLHYNHRRGEEIYRHYPSARRLSKDEKKEWNVGPQGN